MSRPPEHYEDIVWGESDRFSWEDGRSIMWIWGQSKVSRDLCHILIENARPELAHFITEFVPEAFGGSQILRVPNADIPTLRWTLFMVYSNTPITKEDFENLMNE